MVHQCINYLQNIDHDETKFMIVVIISGTIICMLYTSELVKPTNYASVNLIH